MSFYPIRSLAVLLALSVGYSVSSHAQTASSLNCNASYGVSAFVSSVSTTSGQQCYDKAIQFIDAFSNSGLRTFNSSYNGTGIVDVKGRFSDVDINAGYANPFNGNLAFSIPQLGVNVTFIGVGATTSAQRDDAQAQLSNYLKKSGVINQIMQYQAAHSPTSAISGAGGLIPSTVASDFESTLSQGSQIAAVPGGGMSNNTIGVGLGYSSYSVANRPNISVYTVPLSYSIRNDIDPRRQLILSLPISVVTVGSAQAYNVGLGAAYRLPMSDHWTLTPGFRYSVVASIDQATVAGLASGTIGSTYVIEREGYDVVIGNMVGYYATQKFSAGSYSFNPGINNTVLRNGVMLSQPVIAFNQAMSVEYSLVDTRYFGTKVFMDNTQQIGVTLGTAKRASSARSYFRGGVSYTHGPGVNGFSANVGYWF